MMTQTRQFNHNFSCISSRMLRLITTGGVRSPFCSIKSLRDRKYPRVKQRLDSCVKTQTCQKRISVSRNSEIHTLIILQQNLNLKKKSFKKTKTID